MFSNSVSRERDDHATDDCQGGIDQGSGGDLPTGRQRGPQQGEQEYQNDQSERQDQPGRIDR